MLWFTSDLHLGHANVLNFTARDWPDIDAMNRGLIEAINQCVMPADDLYILGDYSFKLAKADAARLRDRIGCRWVHLVPGNHDKDWSSEPEFADTFILEPPICRVKADGLKLVLSHYPLMDWPSMSHGSWHLHGHIHSAPRAGLASYNELNRAQGIYRYDVGVDANAYRPVSLADLHRWFDDVECSGRAKWWEWVDQGRDEAVTAECADIARRMREEERD